MRSAEDIISEMRKAKTSLELSTLRKELKDSGYDLVEVSRIYNECRRAMVCSAPTARGAYIDVVPVPYVRPATTFNTLLASGDQVFTPVIVVKDDMLHI